MDPHHPSPWAAPTSARQRQHLHHPPPTSSVSTGNAAAAAPQQHQAYLPPPPPPHLLQLQHQQHQQQHGQLHQHHSHQQLYHHHHQQQQQLADSSSSQPPHDHFYEPPSLASVSSSSSVTTQGSPLVTPSHSLGNFPGLDQQQQQQSTASSSSSDTHNPNAPSLAKRPLKHPPRGAQACIRCKSRKQRCEQDLGEDAPCRKCRMIEAECIFEARDTREKRQRVSGGANSSPAVLTLAPSREVSGGPSLTQPRRHTDLDPQLSASSASGAHVAVYRSARPLSSSNQPKSIVRPNSGSARDERLDSPCSTPRTIGGGASSSSGGVEHPTPDPSHGVAAEQDNDLSWSDDAARGVAFLSLSASGSPIYVGPSSGFSWARLVLASLATEHPDLRSARHLPLQIQPMLHTPMTRPEAPPEDLPMELDDSILTLCYKHIQARYPAIDWLAVHDWWQCRGEIIKSATLPQATKETRTAAFFLLMLYAIGAQLVPKSAARGLASSEAYYAKAMEHLDVVLGLHDLKNVQALILMVTWSYRAPNSPSVWFLSGIVVRLVISLGLHRSLSSNGRQAPRLHPYVLQLRKRIFWAAYTLDRMVSVALGRPPGIHDSDIDIELPLDIDCIELSPVIEPSPWRLTSMSSSLHLIKLKRIESVIQAEIYRVDRPYLASPDALLALVDDWESQIPIGIAASILPDAPCLTRDVFLLRAAEARLYILRPYTVKPDREQRHVSLLANCAANACELHKRIHSTVALNDSLESLRSIFLCGLTLLHAVQLDPFALPMLTLHRAVRATSNTMYAYAQLFLGAQALHNAFDDLASVALSDAQSSSVRSRPPPPPKSVGAGGAQTAYPSGGGGVGEGSVGDGQRQQQQQQWPHLSQQQQVQRAPLSTPALGSAVDVWQDLATSVGNHADAETQSQVETLLSSWGLPLGQLFSERHDPHNAWGVDPFSSQVNLPSSGTNNPLSSSSVSTPGSENNPGPFLFPF